MIEIGVGLIACNLPVMSYSAVRSLIRHLRRGWIVSRSGLRRTFGRMSVMLNSQKSHTGSTLAGLPPKRWSKNHRGVSRLDEDRSEISVSDIPLVERKLGAGDAEMEGEPTPRYDLEPVDDRNGRVQAGGDIV